MRNIKRSIEEVRQLRGDLSNYLIHVTRDKNLRRNGGFEFRSAKDSLIHILDNDKIDPLKPVGQFSHKFFQKHVNPDDLRAVCLTETPIEQLYLFFGIQNRSLNFREYGLVFDQNKLSKGPTRAAPVLYFSQPIGSDFHFVNQFNKMATEHYDTYKDILYLYDRFGKYQVRDYRHSGELIEVDYNFRWEREWRIKGTFNNVKENALFGLCPDHEIEFFENKYELPFVDPFFHPQQIKSKLNL